MKNNSIKYIFFDLDGTLCYFKKDFGTVFTDFFQTDFEHVSKKWNEISKKSGACTSKEAIKHTFNFPEEKATLMSKEFSKVWGCNQTVFPGVFNLIEKLKLNYKIGVLTNGPFDLQLSVLKQTGLIDLLDLYIISGDEKISVRKPNIDIFKKAEALINTSSNRILMIGDSYTSDIKGAIDAGWKSLWVNPTLNDFKGAFQHSIFSFVEQDQSEPVVLNWESILN